MTKQTLRDRFSNWLGWPALPPIAGAQEGDEETKEEAAARIGGGTQPFSTTVNITSPPTPFQDRGVFWTGWRRPPETLWGTNIASNAEPSEPMSLSAFSRPLRPGGLRTF